MRITAIPQFARNAGRVREIVTIISKYGLADWLARLNIGLATRVFLRRRNRNLARITQEARIRTALAELGTTFIKFGQVLSTRADLVGSALAAELTKLQADVPADPPEVVRKTIETELGKPINELFASFDDQPLASASIAQVHRATLKDGTQVVVKVQHPGIEDRIQNDLDILGGLAYLAEQYVEELRPYQPSAVAAEFEKSLMRELDFGRELRNLERFIANFGKDTAVRFPKPYPALSTARVLTMDHLDGVRLADAHKLGEGINRGELAKHGARVFLEMIFRDGFFHADPHPGNLLIMADGSVGILDVGMVGQLTNKAREEMENLLAAIAGNDADRLATILLHMCGRSGDVEPVGFTSDVADFVGYYSSQSLNKVDISGALSEMTSIIRRHRLVLPANIAMLLRVLVLLEGTSRLLHPEFKLIELIEPFQKKLQLARMSPVRLASRMTRVASDWEYLVEILPTQMLDVLHRAQRGRLEVQLQHHHLDPSVNRLVLGIVTAALFVGSSLLWGQQAPPTIYNVSVPGVLGTFLGAVCATRLVVAVLRSGSLDR
jgi:ubiquinone biosynthesis protein